MHQSWNSISSCSWQEIISIVKSSVINVSYVQNCEFWNDENGWCVSGRNVLKQSRSRSAQAVCTWIHTALSNEPGQIFMQLRIAHCTLHIAHCTLHITHCTLRSLTLGKHCTLHLVHYTLGWVNYMHLSDMLQATQRPGWAEVVSSEANSTLPTYRSFLTNLPRLKSIIWFCMHEEKRFDKTFHITKH